jgi:hypothetical protein
VVFGHGGYFHEHHLKVADTARLVRNAVFWAAGRKGRIRVAVHRGKDLAAKLRAHDMDVTTRDEPSWWKRIGPADVLYVDAHALRSAEAIAAVQKYVRAGGGLLTAGLTWGWLQLNPGKTQHDQPGNRLLAEVGILFADGYVDRTAPEGYRVAGASLENTHAARALERLRRAEDVEQTSWIVTQAARTLPAEDKLLRPKLARIRGKYGRKGASPLDSKAPLARLALTLQIEEMKRRPPEKVRAHRTAAVFPGRVPATARRVTRTNEVDTAIPGWHSTGLYAPPGEPITVELPRRALGRNLRLRIGAHNDRLWHKERWKRAPEICLERALDETPHRSASAFGGLLYLEVPRDCDLGTIDVRVKGAVGAPHYVHGVTDPNEWRSSIRKRPAPWAELQTRKVILTVPSEVVRELDDPAALMDLWDGVLDACADLAAIPRERTRPERYVADVQISAGYMHSGYPIMTHLDAAARMVDLERMRKGDWGMFHEMGHNHQQGDWTFAGTGEVTCNLFTLYVYEKVCGIPVSGHERINGKKRDEMIRAYLEGGRRFDAWKRKPFLALLAYCQLQEAFGWEPFRQVFHEYRALRKEERPKGDGAKRDQLLTRFSRRVGHDLGPFLEAWGVPTSAKARASVADLPPWMPEGFPPP